VELSVELSVVELSVELSVVELSVVELSVELSVVELSVVELSVVELSVVVELSLVVVVVDSVQLSELDFDVYVATPDSSEAKTTRMPPCVSVKPDVIGRENASGLVLPARSIVSSLSWTFSGGVALEPLFAAR
jgi:hypothetical protein